MKKILLIAAVIGLIAVPSFVVAKNRADDNKRQNNQQEDNRNNQDNNNASENQSSASKTISQEEAVEIAQKTQPNKTVYKVEVEDEKGVVIYSVRFTDNGRVDVRSSDGKIVRDERGDTDDSSGNSGSTNSDSSGRDHPEDD